MSTPASRGHRIAPRVPYRRRLASVGRATLVGGLFLVAVGSGGCGAGDGVRLSVVFISIDTLRAKEVSGYGADRPTTPHLDRFAEECVVFRDAVCNSNNTLTSHASLLTSLLPSVHGVAPGVALRDDHETLTEILDRAGYETAFFAAHGDWLTERYGFARGADRFRTGYVKAPQVDAWAQGWLTGERSNGGKRARPFFLFLHYYDAHSDFAREGDLPYDAPPGFRRFRDEVPSEFDGCSPDGEVCASAWLKRLSDEGTRLPENDRERIRALYAEEVAYTDAMVGRVLRSLRGTGILDRAIVVITSDHGEEFQEHGRFLHESVFEPVVRVPLWIRFPRGEHAGVVDSLAQGIDVAPTILDALGFSIPDAMQGRSLLSIVRGEPSPKRYALIQSLALRTERFKAMPDGGGGRGRLLFDLASDPGETTDVSSRYPEVLEDMERWLVEMMERHDGMAARFGGRVGVTRPVEEADGPAAIPSRRVEMDPHERARLEALGYTVPEGG